MTTVMLHPFAGVLSAYGMGLADIRATRQQAIEEGFGGKSLGVLNKTAKRLAKNVSAEVAGQGVPAQEQHAAGFGVFERSQVDRLRDRDD